MKKLLLSTLVVVSLVSSAFADPSKNSHVVRTFETEYPNATNVKWKTAGNYTKASFIENNVSNEIFYNADGEVMATSQAATIESLPIGDKRALAKKYSNLVVKEAIKLTSGDETAYYISAEGEKSSMILKVMEGNIEVVKVTRK